MANDNVIHLHSGLTLADNPRLYLKNRSQRMVRLIELDAPFVVIEGEFKLIAQAMNALIALRGVDPNA